MSAFRMWLASGWEDPWFEQLHSAERVAFFYLVIGPNSRPSGLFVQSLRHMAGALNTTPEALEKILAKFEEDGKVLLDRDRNLVWVVNAWSVAERLGANRNVRKGVEKDLRGAAESPLVQQFLERYPEFAEPPTDPSDHGSATGAPPMPHPWPTHAAPMEHPSPMGAPPMAHPPIVLGCVVKEEPPPESGGRPRRARKPDEVWDSLVAVFAVDASEMTKVERKRWNTAAQQLRDAGATPGEIQRRAARYRREHPSWELTPMALASNWSTLATRKPRPATVDDQAADPEPEMTAEQREQNRQRIRDLTASIGAARAEVTSG